MRKLFIMCMILVAFTVSSQDKFRLYTELSQGDFLHWYGDSQYLESGFQLGGLFNTPKGSYIVYGIYKLGGHLYISDKTKDYHLSPFTLRYSSIGIGIIYRIFDLEKKLSPLIRIEVVTEMKSKNESANFYINDSQSPTYFSNSNSYPKYYATPLIGSLTAGIDWNVVRNFNINFGVGFGMRWIETRLGSNLVITKRMEGINVQLGFSYSFSFKKPKTK